VADVFAAAAVDARAMLRTTIVIAATLALAPAAHAATFQVDTVADVPVGSAADCTDADTGTPCSVRDALAAAAGSDEDDRVEVPAGDYVLTGGSLHTSGAFAVTIAGAGAGLTTFDGDDLSRVLELDANTTIEGVRIRDGRDAGQGGGILADGTALVLRDSVVESNEAEEGGGIAIGTGAEASLIERSAVRDNRADSIGGGIRTADGGDTLTIVDSTVASNRAEPASGGSAGGGGIWADSGLRLSRVAVTQNVAFAVALADDGATGGGILSLDNLQVVDSTVAGNSATGTNGAEARGGGLYLSSTVAKEIRGSTIAGNAAAATGGGAEGGGIREFGAGVEITNSTISGNTVSAAGGALSARGGGATLDAATLTNVTLAGNTASGNGAAGGALFSPDAVLRNTIVSGDCVNAVAQATNSIDSGTSCGLAPGAGNRSGVDPLLGPLASNGGLTETRALLAGSPALDAGTAVGAPATDQRTVARPQGAGVDIGAFELEVGPPPPGGGAPAVDTIAPVFTGRLALSPPAFRAGAGTTIRFALSEAAAVALRVERRAQGRRVGGRCRKRTRQNRAKRPCTRYVPLAGRFTRAGTAGANRMRFSGRLRGRPLGAARYRLLATAIDAAGNRSATARAAFRILPPRRRP
jgi:hypothetical protein